MKLSEMKENKRARVRKICGSTEFQRRITAVGITLNHEIEMLQNDRRNPVMIYVRNTVIALNRRDSEKIEVEEA